MSDELSPAQKTQSTVFLQNLVKLIPVEIVALWAIVSGFIPATAAAPAVWIMFGLLAVLVPFYVIFAMKVKKWDQVVLMTLAFPIWVFAIGGLPALGIAIAWFEPWMMSVALAMFTLVPPMFYGKRVTPEELEEKIPQETEVVTDSVKIAKTMSWRQVEA